VSTPNSLNPADLDIDELKELIILERGTSYLWEYRYLNYYLAPGTIAVLDWFAGLPTGRTTFRACDASLSQFVSDPVERNARLTALTRHYLLVQDGVFRNEK
jgi:hypothetical protein